MNTFTEKYEPQKFADLVFHNADVRQRLNDYACNKRDGSILLHGDYGVGKSAIARIVAVDRIPSFQPPQIVDLKNAAELDANFDDDLYAMCRAMTFHAGISGVRHPYAVIDEVDMLSRSRQFKLRAHIDSHKHGSFILTTNHKHLVDRSLLNRCDVIEIESLTTDDLFEPAKRILAAEGVNGSDKDLRDLLDTVDGSWRDALRAIEDIVLSAKAEAA